MSEVMNTVLDDLKNAKETVWINPGKKAVQPRQEVNGYGFVYMQAAQARLLRFMPFIERKFPDTAARKGLIESKILEIPQMDLWLRNSSPEWKGKILLKDDAHLPVAGSVKARGGVHEVLHIAERLAFQAKKLQPTDKYSVLDSDEFREFFGQYTIQVGSTGNLGLSIGIMGAALGFQVIVHMSSDAKQWKKDLLREKGVIVKEYDGDYSLAVAQGRRESENDPYSFFVDDEKSEDLFFGYSSAALRLDVQLHRAGISVSRKHPLFVYLPCGVGGAPGGITFGLKQLYGDAVHCFFVEPVQAPCMVLGLASGKYNEISVSDLGLSGRTEADGLAVGRSSAFAGKMMDSLVSGCFTVEDKKMMEYMRQMDRLEHIFLEPSACAGFYGVQQMIIPEGPLSEYIGNEGLTECMDQATHLIWTTGGGMVPESEKRKYLNRN